MFIGRQSMRKLLKLVKMDKLQILAQILNTIREKFEIKYVGNSNEILKFFGNL